MSKHQLRVDNEFKKKSELRVGNYPPLGVISHPNRQILAHCRLTLGDRSAKHILLSSTNCPRPMLSAPLVPPLARQELCRAW